MVIFIVVAKSNSLLIANSLSINDRVNFIKRIIVARRGFIELNEVVVLVVIIVTARRRSTTPKSSIKLYINYINTPIDTTTNTTTTTTILKKAKEY